jgi:predicted permease
VPLRDFAILSIGARVEDRTTRAEEDPEIPLVAVSPGYFETMGVTVIRGRPFTAADRAGTESVAIVNQGLGRIWWGEADPLGRRVQVGGFKAPWTTIVGVVANVHHEGLDRPARPMLYMPFEQRPIPFGFVAVLVKGGPQTTSDAIRLAIRETDPSVAVYDVATMSQRLTASVAERRFLMTLLFGFAALATLLAMIGLYAMLSSLVAERTREIGIRLALGAAPASIRRIVVGQATLLVAIGATIGLVAAYGLAPALSSWLFGIGPADPLTFAAVPIAIMLTALISVWPPARRATIVDPAITLREP